MSVTGGWGDPDSGSRLCHRCACLAVIDGNVLAVHLRRSVQSKWQEDRAAEGPEVDSFRQARGHAVSTPARTLSACPSLWNRGSKSF